MPNKPPELCFVCIGDQGKEREYLTCCNGEFKSGFRDGNWKCNDKIFRGSSPNSYALKNQNQDDICKSLSTEAARFHKDLAPLSWSGDLNSYPLGKDCGKMTCPTSTKEFMDSLGGPCKKKVEEALKKQKSEEEQEPPLLEE